MPSSSTKYTCKITLLYYPIFFFFSFLIMQTRDILESGTDFPKSKVNKSIIHEGSENISSRSNKMNAVVDISREKCIFFAIFIFQDGAHFIDLLSNVNIGFQECLGFYFLSIYGKRIQGKFNASVRPQLRNGNTDALRTRNKPKVTAYIFYLYYFPTHEASCCVNEDTKMECEEVAFTFIKTFGFCVPIIF